MMRRTEATLWDAIGKLQKEGTRIRKRIRTLENKVKAQGVAPKQEKQEPVKKEETE